MRPTEDWVKLPTLVEVYVPEQTEQADDNNRVQYYITQLKKRFTQESIALLWYLKQNGFSVYYHYVNDEVPS